MASDEAYGAFLDKANEDPNPPSAKSASSTSKGKKSGVKSVDAEVPPALQEADGQHFYVSDADEPFVPVSLKWNGEETIDDDTFAKTIGHDGAKVSQVSRTDFDPRGQYAEVIALVEKAAGGRDSVTIFRVDGDGARAEYWVVGLEKGGEKLVGLKATSIES